MSALNLYVLLTIFSWGIWGIFDKKALGHVKQADVLIRLWILAIVWVPVSFVYLYSQSPDWQLNQTVVFWTFMASVANTVSLFAYLAAMSTCEASYVLGMTSAYPLVFQLLATVTLGEALVGQRLMGALVIGAGLFLISGSGESVTKEPLSELSLSAREQTNKSKLSLMSILYIVVATLGWGVYGLFDKLALKGGGPPLVFFSKTCWDFFLLFPLLAAYHIFKVKVDWQNKPAWMLCGVSEFFLGLGGLSYLAALALSSASYVITITGCYPLLMYLFAICLLKEKFNKLRFAGIIFIVAGAVLVQLTEGL